MEFGDIIGSGKVAVELEFLNQRATGSFCLMLCEVLSGLAAVTVYLPSVSGESRPFFLLRGSVGAGPPIFFWIGASKHCWTFGAACYAIAAATR